MSTIKVVGAALFAVAASCATVCQAAWTGPMPIVPGTNHTDEGVFRQNHTQYIIPREACDTFRQYEICWRAAPTRAHGLQESCAKRFSWHNPAPNWDYQVQTECKVDQATIDAARRAGSPAQRAVPKPQTADTPKSRGTIHTYLCQVPTTAGMKRRRAWVYSQQEAVEKAYADYQTMMTVGKDRITCEQK